MKNYRPGDVLLLLFPFTEPSAGKRRPALVLADTGDEDVVVARVTSQPADTPFDLKLSDWEQAGLIMPSTVRLHKLATIEKVTAVRRLGSVTARDWSKIREVIRDFWNLMER